ncbi:MAG TPA: alanine--glyoxylate aminotransferase family protein [Candidatus Cybelea sp.]|jgi:aspartate aminotransferase-like enzyme|nr:alanine--glyoxylate aminotransferase family protein [Candidatus Cybelea sp.]
MPRQLLFLPGPVTVAQPVLEAAARPLINHRDDEFGAMLERITGALPPVFGTKAEVLLLGSSGTGGLEAVLANLFSPGARLLSCAVGAFGKRFAEMASEYGCVVEPLETPLGAALDPAVLAARLDRDERREIDGVLLTHNETSTGVACDMAAIGTVLRAHGAISLVDSVSGIAASEFRMDEWGYDAVVTASQKGFAAPPGVAMVALSERAWKRTESARSPRYYFDLRRARDFARIGETPWTPPISILYALDVALQRYHAEGMATVVARHARFAAIVRDAFERMGFTLVSRPGAHSPTIVAAYPPEGVDPKRLLKDVREKHGVVLAGGQGELAGKIVRFGTMGDVGEAEVLGALDAIECEVRVTSGVVESTA